MLVLRDLLISDGINQRSTENIVRQILAINEIDKASERAMSSKYVREPIRIFINSGGGGVYTGLAIVDAIKQSKTPIHVISLGHSMSMGLWILMAADKRFIGKNSTLMYHEVSTGIEDKLEGIKMEVRELERLQKVYDKAITSNTSVSQETLDSYKKRKAEWYISADEAIKLGFAKLYTK